MYRAFSSSSASKKQQPDAAALKDFVQVWQYTAEDYTIALEWTTDGKRVAVVPESGPIVVLDAATGEVRHELKGHRGGNNAASWHPAGHMLATGGQDGVVRLWTFSESGAPQSQDLEGGEQMVEHLAWSRPENSNPLYPRLASAAGHTLRLWDSTGKLVREHARFPKAISALKWLGSKQMVSTSSFGGVSVWGTSDGQLKRTLEYKNPLISLSWSPDLRWAAAGTQDQGIHIWRTTHQPDEMQMSGFATKVREMSWHKGSRWFVTGGAPEVAVWDCGGPGPAGREPRQLVWHEGNVSAVACQHRGALAVSGARDGGLAVWNIESPHVPESSQVETPLATMNFASEIVQAGWSFDDRLVVIGDADGEVRLFRVGT